MRNLTFKAAMLKGSQPTVNRQSTDGQSQRHCKQTPLSKRWKVLMTLVFLFTFAIGNVWAALTAHTPGVYEKATSQGGYGATLVTVSSRQYEVYGFSYNSSGSKPQILWAGTSTNNASDSHVLCSTLSTTPQEIAGWISMSTVSKSSTYSMPSGTEFAASSVGSTGLYQMKLQGHSITLIFKGYDQFSFLGNDNNGDKSKGKYLQVYINGADSTKDVSSSTTVRRWTLNPSTTYTIVITGLGSSNEHIDAFSLRLPACQAPTTAFSEGAYTVGESALALSSLIVENSNNSDGAITYVVKTDGGTGASIATGSFTATAAGTATITATQAADATNNKCEKIIDFNVVVTASSCAATIPGDISKGALTAGEITLTADGSAESGDIWYWQDAADGTATNLGTGETKNINTAGMYYIRSYNTAGDCWSAAKSIEVTAEELLEHYAITYNKGAYGTGEIAGGEKVEDVAYALSSSMFTRENYLQVGWATTDGASRSYMMGGSYTANAAQEFFPAWAEKDTYVDAFHYDSENPAAPAGWTFSSGDHGATSTSVDYEGVFGGTCPASGSAANVNYIAFAKNAGAYATYDLGYVTTVSAVTGTFYVGSSNERTFKIEYIASDGTTVLHTISTTTNSNWGEKAVNETAIVPNVRYIKISSARKGNDFSWLVMSAFSVTYGSLVTKYNVTFDKNGGSGDDMATLKYAEGAEVTLPATSTFTAPDDMEFDAWISDDVTISNNKFTMPNKAVTIKATWKSACALAPTVSATTLGTTSYTTQVVNCAGISVLGSAGCTISEYGFVYGTATAPTISDNKKALEGDYTVAGTAFAETTLTGLAANTKYYVRAYATNSFGTAYGEEISFTTLAPLGNVLVIAGSASQTSDAITAMRNAGFVVTVSAHDHERSYAGYDLVVLDESLGGSDAQTATNEESKIKDVNIPILNLKAFFYTKTNRWNWGSPVNGTGGNEIANIPTTYKNTQSHPIFEGLTITAGAIDLIDPAKSGNTLQGVTTNTLVEGKEGYTLATSGDGITFIHELTPAQRGVTDAKYLMIAFANNAKDNLSADGERLIVNAAKYLVGSTAWDPEYYTVSFEAHGDADPSPLTGKTITLPSATNGTESFLGWFTEATGGEKIGDAGESYTPSADITLHAQWEAVSSDARLASITFSAVGTLAPEFNPEVTSYTYTMPYGTAAIPTITGATSVSDKAQEPVIVQQAAAWNETAIIRGKAQSGDTKAYNVTMKMAPKDGVVIIHADIPSGTSADYAATGLYAGTGNSKNEGSSLKLGTNHYAGVNLSGSEIFKEGDILNIHVKTKNGFVKAPISTTNAVDGSGVIFTEERSFVVGDNFITLTSAFEEANSSSLYLVRTTAIDAECNPAVDYIEVTRAMNPVLTAITINGRDGEIDALDDKHFTVTIPNDAILASLTVVPTIVRNAAHATTPEAVISNEGAWVLTADGDNTYRIMDKDGDYTDYTITLVRDVVKHTVRFMDGTSEFASALVADGESPVAPATDPTKEDYLFQGWAETVDGDVITDWSTISISAAKDFYAKWVSDGAIKLIEAGAINTTNFVTGGTLSSGTVSVDEVNYKYITLAGTNGEIGSASNVTTDRFVMYHATTTKTKIQIHAYANGNARQVRLSGLVEGASTLGLQQTINVAKNDDELTEYFSFDSDKHRTFYITIPSSADDVYLLQVKVIESGEPLAAIGTAGTSFNFNKGRLFAPQGVATSFDGIDIKTYNKYAALSTEYAELSAGAISFYVPNDVCLSVASNANGTNKYYVTNEVTGTDNETTTANAEFNLTGGKTWYIRLADSNKRVRFTNIAFTAPKCEKPTITAQPATKQTFGPGNLTATVVADDPSDGGTLKYQWYDAATNEEVENATEATLTTTTPGKYYVIVTNTLADHSDNSVKSDEATLGYRVMDDATLSVLKYGETAIALEDDKYDYRVDLAMGTIDVPELTATATMAPYPTVVITNATEFVEYEATSTVVVTAEDGVTQKTYTVKFVVDHVYTALVDVTGSTTWNWTGSEEATINDVANKGLILANYIDGLNFEKIEGKEGERARRDQNDGVYQGTHLHFNTTVPGKVKFYFRAPSSGEECVITVINNGKEIRVDSTGNSFKWSREVVVYGDVVIEMENKKEGKTDTRVQQIVFTEATPNYSRDVTNNIGTLCVDHNVLAGGAMGATFYQIASRNELYNDKIDFEEVLPNEELKAGEPYIFQSTTGKIELFYADGDAVTEPVVVRGMIGSFVDTQVDIDEENKSNILYIASNKLWNCEDLVGVGLQVVENRAYIDMAQVPTYADYQAAQTSNPAPRRRVTLGKDAEQIATGFENINAGDKPMKLMINGQMYILRGEKMYDATGRLVK